MDSRLINVRLDRERLRKVRSLRARGIVLSDLVRQAIDERYEAPAGRRTATQVPAVVARIFARYPDPPGLPARAYDVRDRRAARRAIVSRLRRPPR